MRVQKLIRRLVGLAVGMAGIALFVGQAAAQMTKPGDVTIDSSGSLIIFPKVIADEARDTLITISNMGNIPAMAHCVYVQGAGLCERTPDQVCDSDDDCTVEGAGPNRCLIDWGGPDFDIYLTMKQPTMWRVSTGRRFDPAASFDRKLTPDERAKCEVDPDAALRCPGFFFNSMAERDGQGEGGLVPPVGPNFRGELKCAQVDMGGALWPGNKLQGEATILTKDSPQISRYNALNVLGAEAPENNRIARLNDVEYSACPEALEVTHFANNGTNFIAEGLGATCGDGVTDGTSPCSVRTEITLIPCSQDLSIPSTDAQPETTAVQFEVFDEFETRQTSSTVVECWRNLSLDRFAGSGAFVNSTIKKTRMYTPQNTACRAGSRAKLCLGGAQDGLFCSSNAECDPDANGVPGQCRETSCVDDSDCGVDGVCGPRTGILALVEQFYGGSGGAFPATAATNAHSVNRDIRGVGGADSDVQRIGRCRNAVDAATNALKICRTNAECTDGGLCRHETTRKCQNDAGCAAGDFCDICMNDEIALTVDEAGGF